MMRKDKDLEPVRKSRDLVPVRKSRRLMRMPVCTPNHPAWGSSNWTLAVAAASHPAYYPTQKTLMTAAGSHPSSSHCRSYHHALNHC